MLRWRVVFWRRIIIAIYFALPQFLEVKWLRGYLARHDLSQARSIYIISPSWWDSIAPAVRYDEFGLPSSVPPWSPGPMVYLLIREMNPERADLPTEVAPANGLINLLAAALVVDMRKLSNFR